MHTIKGAALLSKMTVVSFSPCRCGDSVVNMGKKSNLESSAMMPSDGLKLRYRIFSWWPFSLNIPLAFPLKLSTHGSPKSYYGLTQVKQEALLYEDKEKSDLIVEEIVKL